MLLNPNTGIAAIDGSPFVSDRRVAPYIGARVPSGDPRRLWTIQSFLLPISRRALGGIRAKLQDQKGFATFCNQRDLEVLLGLGRPGEMCFWLGRKYVEPGDKNWVGIYADVGDLRDDLYERELDIRCEYPVVPEGMTLTRRLTIEEGNDVEETLLFLGDYDRDSGMSPDPRYETVQNRWVPVERVRVVWDLM